MAPNEVTSKKQRWVDRHGRSLVTLALFISGALLVSSFLSGTRVVNGPSCSYAIHWATTRWHWVGVITGALVTWILASYIRRSSKARTPAHTGLLNGARFMALIAWTWYAFAAFMWPVLHTRHCVTGRPLRIRGRLRLPSVHRQRRDSPFEVPNGLTRSERNRVGAHWLECARGEFASVPAFTRLAVQLAVVDAPLELIDWAERSALEERIHAERTLGLAERMLGRSLALKFDDALPAPVPMTIAELAVESLIDGCLNEGCAALEARLRMSAVDDAATAAVLEMIAVDEQAHAELAWAIVGWARNEQPGDVTAALHAATFSPARSGFASPRRCHHEVLRNFGWIEPAICADAHAQVVQALQVRLAGLLGTVDADRSAQLVSVAR